MRGLDLGPAMGRRARALPPPELAKANLIEKAKEEPGAAWEKQMVRDCDPAKQAPRVRPDMAEDPSFFLGLSAACVMVAALLVTLGVVVFDSDTTTYVGIVLGVIGGTLMIGSVVHATIAEPCVRKRRWANVSMQAFALLVGGSLCGVVLVVLDEFVLHSNGVMVVGACLLLGLGAVTFSFLLNVFFKKLVLGSCKQHQRLHAALAGCIAAGEETANVFVLGVWCVIIVLVLPHILIDDADLDRAEQAFTILALIAAARVLSVAARLLLSFEFVTRTLRQPVVRTIARELFLRVLMEPAHSGHKAFTLHIKVLEDLRRNAGGLSLLEWPPVLQYIRKHCADGTERLPGEIAPHTRGSSRGLYETYLAQHVRKEMSARGHLRSEEGGLAQSDFVMDMTDRLLRKFFPAAAEGPKEQESSVPEEGREPPSASYDAEQRTRCAALANTMWTEALSARGDRCEWEDVENAVQQAFVSRDNLVATLEDARRVLRSIDRFVFSFGLLAVLYTGVGLYRKDFLETWVAISTFVIAFSYIFGDAARTSLSSILFIFVRHPYSVGDTVVLSGLEQGERFAVRRIRLQHTEFRSWSGRHATLQNDALARTVIFNLSVNNYRRVMAEALIDLRLVNESSLAKMTVELKAFVKMQAEAANPTFARDASVTVHAREFITDLDNAITKVRCRFRADALAPIADDIQRSLEVESAFNAEVAAIINRIEQGQ